MELSPFHGDPSRDGLGRSTTATRWPVEDQVLITGDVSQDWVIRTSDLDAHARDPIVVRYVTKSCEEVHQVQGVPLHHILARVRLRRDKDRKMDHLNFVVIARAEDGYQVLLSWAEVDPEFGACAALLATRYNGQTLTLPTLVLPSDGRASRYLRRLRCVQLVKIDHAAPAQR